MFLQSILTYRKQTQDRNIDGRVNEQFFFTYNRFPNDITDKSGKILGFTDPGWISFNVRNVRFYAYGNLVFGSLNSKRSRVSLACGRSLAGGGGYGEGMAMRPG